MTALERRNTDLEKEVARLRALVEQAPPPPALDIDGFRIGIAQALGVRLAR